MINDDTIDRHQPNEIHYWINTRHTNVDVVTSYIIIETQQLIFKNHQTLMEL